MEEGRSIEAAMITATKNEDDDEGGGGFKYIPEEIVLKLLPNLPAESLLRFRCVSKRWSRHISPGITQGNKVIVPSNKHIFFESVDQNAQVENIAVELEGTISSHNPRVSPHIYGSCNGFLLIGVGLNLLLWNPSTRLTYGMLTCRFFMRYTPQMMIRPGLCFDSYNNEYKVVLGLIDRDWRDRSVRVGSFKTQAWSGVDFSDNVSHFKPGPTLNNYVHWWSTKEILYFDPKRSSFTKMSLPKDYDGRGEEIFGLGVLDGCLAMVVDDFTLYRMTRYGVKDSWEIMFVFDFNNDLSGDRELKFTHVIPLFTIGEKNCRVFIHVRRVEYEKEKFVSDSDDPDYWYYWDHKPAKKLADVYAIVAYDVRKCMCTDIAVSKVGKEHYDGPVVYEETLVTPSNSQSRGFWGGKQIWKVKEENKPKSTKPRCDEVEEEEENKVMEGVEEKWEEPRKTRRDKRTKGKRPVATLSPPVDPILPMNNAFDLLNDYE